MTTVLIGKILMGGVIAAIVGILAFFVLNHFVSPKSDDYAKSALKRLSETSLANQRESFANVSILKDQPMTSSPFGRVVLDLPGMRSTYELLLKSGNGGSIPAYVAFSVLLMGILGMLLFKVMNPFLAVPAALLVGFYLPRMYLKSKIRKRNDKFINLFPDALDMIVRSVKSGYPLNTALKMLAENSEPPVSTEFKQLADEIAYGRTLNEALQRLSDRLDEPDIHFFVVVLAVQQETGGNLAEVLGNLAGIIRKRKQLKLKIRAMTSEGRATGYVLGGLPFVVFGILQIMSPQHLEPLFTTQEGHYLVAIALALIGTAVVVVKKMVNFDI